VCPQNKKGADSTSSGQQRDPLHWLLNCFRINGSLI
jgi:hypothetical protein